MLKIGLIGYGKMGKIRREILDNLPNCEVIAVCESNDISIDLPVTKEPLELIKNPDINAILVSTPNFLIKDLVVESLKHGKHIFAEKPPGISLAQVKEMQEVSAQYPHLKVKFGFNHRYHDAIMEAKKHIDTGEYGKILWMRGRYGKSVDEDFAETWRANKNLSGGGILMDQGIHMLDLFLMFAGEFNEVKSFCSSDYWNMGIEDNVFAMFRNKKGQTASLHSTMTQWRHLFSLEIFLEKGYMVVNGILSSTKAYTKNGFEELTIAKNRAEAPVAKHDQEEKFSYDTDYSFNREMDEFTQCIFKDEEIKIGTLNDAEKLMSLIEEIYKDDPKTQNTHRPVEFRCTG